MRKPVYGFELDYEVDRNGSIYNLRTGRELKMDAGASSQQKRFRLNDRKRYDGSFLTFKSFNREIDLEDCIIIHLNDNYYDTSLDNLKILEMNNSSDCESYLGFKYGEKVKRLVENENYYISETGKLISFYYKSKIIKPHLRKDGYLEYKISNKNNKLIHIKAHRCVATYFISEINDGLVVNHIDGNKKNNHFSNLEIVTSKDNNYHAWNINLGSKHNKPKECCVVDNNTGLIIARFESVNLGAKAFKVDSSTASKQCRGIKGQFQKGFKFRFWDKEKNTFVRTRFD